MVSSNYPQDIEGVSIGTNLEVLEFIGELPFFEENFKRRKKKSKKFENLKVRLGKFRLG